MPQVYYVGLLAGENQPDDIERQGDRRAINRYNYARAAVETELQKPVVQRLLHLIRFRNTHPAFEGDFEVQDTDESQLRMAWRKGADWCRLQVDLTTTASQIAYTSTDGVVHQFSP